jgi:uncharacterized protein (TIGR02466 family)
MIKEQFFPTIIYGKDLQLNNQLFANEIIEWSKRDPGLKKTNRNGWHSETNMHKKPVFQPLVNELFVMMKEVWLDREPVLGNMWANINPPGGYNKPHVHPNSTFSGVYYIKGSPNCGKLVCNDPRPGVQTHMPTRKEGKPPKELWREVHIDPQENRAIVFPAWLWHCVEPNESNDIRISVSFNFIQHGF